MKISTHNATIEVSSIEEAIRLLKGLNEIKVVKTKYYPNGKSQVMWTKEEKKQLQEEIAAGKRPGGLSDYPRHTKNAVTAKYYDMIGK